jgi:hypothetical protein
MRTIFSGFLNLLEKGSAFLEKIFKPMERRMAYFFCILKILTSIFAEAFAVGFFVVQFRKPVSWDIRVALILFLAIVSFLLGFHIHMIINRDMKQLRETDTKKKMNQAKDKKIEY